MQHNVAFYKKENGLESAKPEKEKSSEKKILLSEEIDDFIDEMRIFMSKDIPETRNLKAIAEAAEYNIDVIKEKYDLFEHAEADNPTGWMISAIKGDYKKSKPKEKKNTFNDMMHTDYDFEEIEKNLLGK